MRILFILSYYLPYRSGLTLYVVRLANELIKRGYKVTILCFRHNKDLPIKEVNKNLKIIRVPPSFSVSRGFFSLTFLLKIIKEIIENDVISLHSPQFEIAWAGLFGRLFNKKVIITHHADLVLPKGFTNRIIDKVMYTSFWIGAYFSNHLVAYSNDYKKHSLYLKKFQHKITCIYPPIKFPEPNLRDIRKLSTRYKLRGKIVVGFSGRLVEEKGVDVLFKSLNILLKENVEFVLLFAGEKEVHYENKFRKWKKLIDNLGNRIIFLGVIQDEQELSNFYASLDVLALPSRRECFGMVQVESMLSGTPVVATNIFGGRVPIELTKMGILIPPNDKLALAKAILKIAKKKQYFLVNRNKISSIFNINTTIKKYIGLYSS